MSSPSRTVTSLGTSVNVARGGEERGVTNCGAEAWGKTLSPGSLAGRFPPCGSARPRCQQSSLEPVPGRREAGHAAGGFPPVGAPREAHASPPRGRTPRQPGPPTPAPRLSEAGTPAPLRTPRPRPLAAPSAYPRGPGCPPGRRSPRAPRPPRRPRRGPPAPTQQSSRAHRRPRRAAGRAAAAAAGVRGRRAGSAVPSPAGARRRGPARRRGGSVGSVSAGVRARTPPTRPWPRAAPLPGGSGRQSAPLPRPLARRGSGGGRCARGAESEVPPGGC